MKKLKGVKLIVICLMLLVGGSILIAGCSSGVATTSNKQVANSKVSSKAGSKDSDGDGIPDGVEKSYNTNPHATDTDGDGQNDKVDNKPLFANNPIKETSTVELPVKIKDARVEDNATADHLEITLTNTGKEQLKNFDIYYTITDKGTNKQEAYYQKLNLTLPSGESRTLHFDNRQEANHYTGNMNGLYGTSTNGLTFSITLHSDGYKPMTFQVEKAKGTAEVAD